MTGTIPSELGLLTNMELGIFVDANKFTGTIPTEMGQLSNCTLSASFGRNFLTGTIPTQLGQLSLLTDLGYGTYGMSLSHNLFSGKG